MMRIKIKGIFGTFLTAALLQGCSSDNFESAPTGDISHSINVAARVAKHTYARSYQESGPVTNGKYFLCYPTASYVDTVGVVDFDRHAVDAPGMGFVTTPDGSEELKWSLIGGSPVTFYLDNVSKDYGGGPLVTFSEGNNRFTAGIFDMENGSNDLLWGELKANRGTKNLNFDLHHYMSRLKVLVEVVHKENSVEDIVLTDAKVRITNLYTYPATYNRKDGTLGFSESQTRESLPVADASREGYGWKKKLTTSEDGETPASTTYISQDIVLPPQALAEDENRSRLEIELPNGDVYSGILPQVMLIASKETDVSLNYPVVLSFLKEYILTIRTVITEEPPELAFMPVWVVDWVDKGEFTLEAHQSGIYTANNFYSLIEYYNKGNEYQLVRYGYLYTPEGETKPEWRFNFFSSVVLDYNEIYNQMHPSTVVEGKEETKPFTFDFTNYAVYVQQGDAEPIQVNENQLYGIVTGSLTWGN